MPDTKVNGRAPTTWRYCGNQLKLWRTGAGISRDELADAAGYAVDTVKSMEQGVRMPTPQLLDVADDLFVAGGKLRAAAQYLRQESLPAYAQGFAQYEAGAVSLTWYESDLIPGLLQSEGYAQALIGDHCPPLADEVIEERVATRLKRQRVLTKEPPVACGFVLYESALRCPVGGASVFAAQLAHLIDVGRRRNVMLQVLPFARGVPAALSGPMVLLETAEHEHVGYVESQAPGRLITDPDELGTLAQRCAMIRSQALGPRESERFIQQVAEEL